MSHYAVYIWPCYGLAFFLLGMNIILVAVEWRRIAKLYEQHS